MAFPSLASLQRRRRQLETLRGMLDSVEQLLGMVQELRKDRDLTSDEETEAAALIVRRERIAKSISEAGG